MGPARGDIVGGRYRLDRQLGEGGMGVVWAATHLVTHRALALKFVRDRSDDKAAHKRALREARAACAVSHPNVVTVHDVLEAEDGTPVLVMDLLEGESLAARLERERTIAPADAVAIARPLLAALEVAHAAGIIHRDLKPDNLFLTAGDGVKILDFGVAKLRGRDAATKETHRLTETGAMIGTPHYMAPEQAFGEGEIDLRADLWSVGAVLYECLAGVPPTNGENLGQILKALATGRISPLRERASVPPAVAAALVDDLLKIDRDERPASAAEVLRRIDALGEIPATPATLATPARAAEPRTTSRRRGWMVGGAVAVVAVLAIGGVTGRRLWRGDFSRGAKTPVPASIAPELAASPVVSASASASSVPAPGSAPLAASSASAIPAVSVAAKRAGPSPRAPASTKADPKPQGSAGPLLTTVPF